MATTAHRTFRSLPRTRIGLDERAQLVFVGAIIGWVVATMSLLLFVTKLVLGQLTGFVETDGHKTLPRTHLQSSNCSKSQCKSGPRADMMIMIMHLECLFQAGSGISVALFDAVFSSFQVMN